MIYISSGTDITTDSAETGYTSTDISDAAAIAIYNFTADQLPLIVDYSIIQGITEESPVNRIQKLSLLCLQPGFETTDETTLEALTVDWESLSYIAGDADKTFVSNNVYSFNPFNTVSTANNPDIGNPGLNDIVTLVTPLFDESFSQEVYSEGFMDVLKEIKDENFLKQLAKQTDLLPENVSVSASVRHVINYKGHRQTNPKTEIKVLELQPAKVPAEMQLSAATVCTWIGNTLPEDKITVVHMTTGEFIGKIEDINETYDMIYIGMSTESFNMKNGKTDYNDSKMDGLIYTGIGDTFNGSIELAGIREQDYTSLPGGIKAIDGTWNSKANQFRFSGNDITVTKVTELKKYVQAGYPIILADGFVSGSGIDAGKVDNSSYMYEAVSGIYGVYPNVMTQAFASDENNRDTVIKYLNVSKPTIELTAKPVEYADNSNASITADSNDGYYYLKYVFAIDNVTDPAPVSTRYDCRLFIDINADGRYSASERLDDISVRRVSDGTLVLPLKDPVTEIEYYKLAADTEYQVSRQMPQEYVGIIPWKLEVVKNGANQIHASVQGFTRIAAGANKHVVKVLQIMQKEDSNKPPRLNLSKQLSSNPKGIYGQLISNLADFSVTIDAIENNGGKNSLESKGTTDAIFNYLNEYDMLIIGFNDMYDGIGVNSAAALVRYINSGKSVLFTHDTTSLSQMPSAYYPMKENINPITKTLSNTNVVRNTVTGEYRSVDGVVRVYSPYQIPWGYNYVGDYDGSYYRIDYENLYSSEPFLQKTLCTRSIPGGIGDWGYYFNTVIRDAVGLDRYGVTSSISLGGGMELGDLVNVNAPMSDSSIATILDLSRSVAFEPGSGRSKTVNEYQGYTNYALIRFAAGSGNTYRYTNNYYKNRETTDVSQVNKGQITTYPYNVNTAAFGGKDGSITGYGGSYMKIGTTHEQYFQINMNTDDIVVWYCMSNGGYDENSYYDDVPNDCVNAYYIYNKGNVTYSGVGHKYADSLYGPGATQEYVNEAKLFVNTMIAAYQSAVQAPVVAIKQDARGTSDIHEKYVLTDAASVLTDAFSPTDENRAVYYRISDPNVGVQKTVTVQYYVSDDVNGTVDPTVDADRKVSPLGSVTTYNANGAEATDIKGGHVYKLYLADKIGAVEVLDQLKDNNVFSIRLYVKVTTVIGSTSLTALDSIEIKKQQLFDLT